MPPEVRPARREEAAAVAAAYDWLFAAPGVMPSEWDAGRAATALARLMGGDRHEVLVADDLSGFCTVYLDIASVRFGQRAWIEDLAVDPAHRSAGIGKALLDTARAWARERGATHLELDSADTRTDAHRFYEREQPAWRSRSFGYLL
ncbi:MAG: GNAT family N-acetyltransferase [Solirubrobacteraceae bacterium]